jgi:hypothetical protein
VLGLIALLASADLAAKRPDKDAVITITSSPPGAMIYTQGKKRGQTPRTLPLRDILPSLYRPEQLNLGSQIFLKLKGCETAQFPIQAHSVPAKIHANLECNEIASAETPASAAAATQSHSNAEASSLPVKEASPPSVTLGGPAAQPNSPEGPAFEFATVRKKLQELNELHEEGLISDAEYERLRRRVLEYF